ncbi:TlpA family protein disulfide reductase [Maribacter chungangensis]|uniref:TlpA family protein disulfide reductase n=1 Tax=Maribacter chungangensis TaxID=1069117 RepID=A0ABW3B3X6_9FLAO
MKKKHSILCAITAYGIICIFLGCKNKKKVDHSTSTEMAGKITLIFNSPPENWKLNKLDGSYIHTGKHEIKYYKNNIIASYWSPDYSKNTDTLVIENVSKPIEIQHKFRGIENLSYLVRPNDTIEFDYNDFMPVPKSLHRKLRKYDLLFENLKRELIIETDFSHYATHNSVIYTLISMNHNRGVEKNITSRTNRALVELKKEEELLDSLRAAYLISKEYYDFYGFRNQFQKKTLQIKETDSIYKMSDFHPYGADFKKFSSYKEYLEAIVENRFSRNELQIAVPNGNIPDYKATYDSINALAIFDNYDKKYLSYIYLKRIIENLSVQDINDYFLKFKEQFRDTLVTQYIAENYNLTTKISDEFILADYQNNIISFEDILKIPNKKLLYVDFWASWCLPCRKALPNSKKLREEYSKRDIIFVYLALNDDQTNWQIASQKHNLHNYHYSFFIKNSKSSLLIDDWKINSIPRYMLFDKNGVVLHQNAPGPEGPEIRKLLDKYLLE